MSISRCFTFGEQERKSNKSDLHTSAQPSKRQRLSSYGAVNRKSNFDYFSDSDVEDRDSLHDTPVSRKRGFPHARFQAPAAALLLFILNAFITSLTFFLYFSEHRHSDMINSLIIDRASAPDTADYVDRLLE